jgi:ribosomal protein S18 acetylase RimI-like enzyme
MSHNITYRIAANADRNEIEVLFNKHFYPNEPLNASWINDEPVPEDLEFSLAALDEEMSIVAVDVETNRIVGACIIGIDTPKATADVIAEAKTTTNKKWAQYLKLYARLDLESDIFRRFNVRESFHIHALVVDANYRCRSIGMQLMERSFRHGASRGYKVCSVNCSSAFTEKMAIKLEMNRMSSIAMDSVIDEESGGRLMYPTSPHTHITTYAKRL